MSSPRISLDERLDEWGSRLFNVSRDSSSRPRRSKRTPLGSPKPVSAGGRLSTPQARTTYVRQKLQAVVRRAPQVMVKLIRAPKGMKGISNNLTYISRDGLLEIEDQDGQVIKGNEAVADLKTEWRDGGMPIAADSTMRNAFHLVLSMPTRTDPLSVQRAARDFATREFSGFQYAMVLHTFETDPDPQPSPHPHVHLTVKVAGLDGVRLNPRRLIFNDGERALRRRYENMALKPQPPAGFTSRRTNGGRVQHLHDRAPKAKMLDSKKRETHTPGKHQEVMHDYEQIMRTLARSDRGEHRQLAVDLVRYHGG